MAYRFGSVVTDVLTARNDISIVGTVAAAPYTVGALLKLATADSSAREILSCQMSPSSMDRFFEFGTGATNQLTIGYRDTVAGFPVASWTTGFLANTWHVVFGTWDGTTLSLYGDLDPTAKGTNTPANPPLATAGTITNLIGNHPSSTTRSLNGDLGWLAVWSRVLQPAERIRLGQGVAPSTLRTGQVACWEMRNPYDSARAFNFSVTGALLVPDTRQPSLLKRARTYFKKRGTAYTQALTAALSFSGAQAKQSNKTLAGGLSFSGSIAKFISHNLTGTLNFVGAAFKSTSRRLIGGLSFSGAFTASHLFVLALTATLSFVGTVSRSTRKTLAGSLGLTGAVTKVTARTLAATLGFAGTVAKATARTLAAALSFVGGFATFFISGIGHLYTLALTATLSFSGVVNRSTRRGFVATLGSSGAGIGPAIILVGNRFAARITKFLYTFLD